MPSFLAIANGLTSATLNHHLLFREHLEQTGLGYSPDHILGYLSTRFKLSLYQTLAETEMTRQRPVR